MIFWSFTLISVGRAARRAAPPLPLTRRDRRCLTWLPALTLTALTGSAWAVSAHPGLIFGEGFGASFAGLAAVVIPLTGVVFFKRLWILGRHAGFHTAGRLLADYFGGQAIRRVVLLTAILFSVPFLALQLGTAGHLLAGLSGGLVAKPLATLLAALMIAATAAAAGGKPLTLRLAWPGLALLAGLAATAWAGIETAGGWAAFQDALAKLAAQGGPTTRGFGGGDYNAFFALTGMIQTTAGLGFEAPVGGPWTGAMAFGFACAFLGVLAAPAFAGFALATDNPRPFAPQQVWVSAFAFGLLLIFAAPTAGMGALLAGTASHEDALIAAIVQSLAGGPARIGLGMILYAVCHGAAALYLAAATRQLAGDSDSSMSGSLIGALLLCAGLIAAFRDSDPLALVAAAGGAFALAMWLPLAAICWFPWLTGRGVFWGMVAAIAAVLMTEGFDIHLIAYGLSLPWGRWPLTMHSAGWAFGAGTVVAVVVSALSQTRDGYEARAARHRLFGEADGLAPGARGLIPVAWIATAVWFFFGLGPGAVIGNDVFGPPSVGTPKGWTFGIPSIWAWQILFWALGVGLLWFLAYRMGLSTLPRERIDALNAQAAKNGKQENP